MKPPPGARPPHRRATCQWVAAALVLGGLCTLVARGTLALPSTVYHDPKGDAAYWQFLPAVEPGVHYYWTRAVARADVDGDGVADDVAIVTQQRSGEEFGEVVRAYLLVGRRDGDSVSNRSVTVLFDESSRREYDDCPLIYPLIDCEVPTTHTRLDLVDLTGDGIPEVCFYPWTTSMAKPVYLSVHTYRDGEFVPILRRRCYSREGGPRYGDQDGDGAGDIILSNSIVVKGTDTASDPDWVSVFEWNGEEFVDDTKSYYASDDGELMDGYVRRYESNTLRDAAIGHERHYHEYEFYMGMIHLYKGETTEATRLLDRVAELAEREEFRTAARHVLDSVERPAQADSGRHVDVTQYRDPPGDSAYWDFLPAIDASEHWYWTRASARSDIDGDGKPDDVAVVTLQQRGSEFGTVARAYLLVGDRDEDAIANRSVTVLFDVSDRVSYEDCPLYYPLIDWEAETTHTRLDLMDFTGDGIPEVCFYPWTTSMSIPVYLSVHTYRDGEFIPILRRRCHSRMGGPRYGDQDGDGAGDIILSNSIVVKGTDTASDPDWVSVFEWNGEEFVDDTKSYYASDEGELMDGYVRRYESNTQRDAAIGHERYYHEYEFYMGMIHLYKGELHEATSLLERVAELAEREVFQESAREMLFGMARTEEGP